jgi:hypothetical protein
MRAPSDTSPESAILCCQHIYACMNVYIYIYIYMRIYACYVSTNTCTYKNTHARTCTHTPRKSLDTRITHAQTQTHTSTHSYTYIHIHTHTYTYIHAPSKTPSYSFSLEKFCGAYAWGTHTFGKRWTRLEQRFVPEHARVPRDSIS